jgi:hypothetical protein
MLLVPDFTYKVLMLLEIEEGGDEQLPVAYAQSGGRCSVGHKKRQLVFLKKLHSSGKVWLAGMKA